MPYAVTADVTAQVGGPIDANSEPTSTEVTTWISDAGIELDGELVAAGFVAVTGASPLAIVKAKVVAKVGAQVLVRRLAGTNFENNEVVVRLMKEWDDFLAAIETNPSRIGKLISQTTGAIGTTRGAVRSHVIDGDPPDPTFTTDMEN